MVCKLIKTCTSVLNAIVGLYQQELYYNNNDILLVY